MTADYQSNRRNYLRVRPDIDHPVFIDINGDNFVDIFRATDISGGGIGIIVPHNFEGCKIEQPVSMIITLPYPVSHSVTIDGSINHIIGEKFGIEYLRVDSEKIKMIRHYILHQLKDAPFITKLKYRLGIH